jgi:hypothetical protein
MSKQKQMRSLFARLTSHQPTVLFSQNKPAISNQPAVLFSQNKPAPAISHQPTEHAANVLHSATTNVNVVRGSAFSVLSDLKTNKKKSCHVQGCI